MLKSLAAAAPLPDAEAAPLASLTDTPTGAGQRLRLGKAPAGAAASSLLSRSCSAAPVARLPRFERAVCGPFQRLTTGPVTSHTGKSQAQRDSLASAVSKLLKACTTSQPRLTFRDRHAEVTTSTGLEPTPVKWAAGVQPTQELKTIRGCSGD
jgi:hypothetical protein